MTDLGLIDDMPARDFDSLRLSKSHKFRESLDYYDNKETKKQELRQLGKLHPLMILEVYANIHLIYNRFSGTMGRVAYLY